MALALALLAGPAVGNEQDSFAEEHEPNNTCVDAINNNVQPHWELDQLHFGNLDASSDDTDYWYRFVAGSALIVTAHVTGVSFDSGVLFIAGPTCTILESEPVNEGETVYISTWISGEAPYYLALSATGGAGFYHLHVDSFEADTDADGVPDASDNCPQTYNPGQEDQDGDGIGTACDPDDCDGFPVTEIVARVMCILGA